MYSRREMLKTIALASGVTLIPLWRGAWAAQSMPTGAAPPRMVVIFLRGAIDGLSVVVPYREPLSRRQARPIHRVRISMRKRTWKADFPAARPARAG